MANPITATTTTAILNQPRTGSPDTETAAQLLERDPLIHDWFALVQKQEDLTAIPMSYADRTAHLPQLLADVIARLRPDFSTKAAVAIAGGKSRRSATQTGILRGDARRGVANFGGVPFSPLCTKTTPGWTMTSFSATL
jgi:hypothetical protein